MRTLIKCCSMLSCALFAQQPEALWVSLLGSPGEDNVEEACFHSDGSILVAGNVAEAPKQMGSAKVSVLGNPIEDPVYGQGMLSLLDPERGQVTRALAFAPGLFYATSVLATEDAVYLGGYGTEGMEVLARRHQGILQDSGLPGERELSPTPFIHRHDPLFDQSRNGQGRPMVLRFSADLTQITGATFLEGWHHIWHVPRPLNEDRHSPVGLGLLANGDLAVVHDGGQMIPGAKGGKSKGFYLAHDHLSRISPDLRTRRWHRLIRSPMVEPSRSQKLEGPSFQSPWMGSVRSLRLRVDREDRIYVMGWSCSQTMDEPWWSSFLIQFSPLDGREAWSGWTVDPTGGGGGRMNGLVSDSVIRSLAFDEQNRLLVATNSDGGNTITRNPPNDYSRDGGPKLQGDSPWGLKGRTLFIGTVQRLNAERSERLGGAYLLGRQERKATAAWPIDVSALSGERVMVLGRYTQGFPQKQAWNPSQGPGSFLRVYSPDFGLQFSTGLDGADLRQLTRKGDLILVAGSTRNALPIGERPPAYQGGKGDGCVLLVRVPEHE